MACTRCSRRDCCFVQYQTSAMAKWTAYPYDLCRLRAALARVKMARDILGKATAYFAKAQS